MVNQDPIRMPGPGIVHNDSAPPVAIPSGHVGPFVIPGTGQLVWWTGRVAIGLRHHRGRPALVADRQLEH
jgi:hypothetical protein